MKEEIERIDDIPYVKIDMVHYEISEDVLKFIISLESRISNLEEGLKEAISCGDYVNYPCELNRLEELLTPEK